MEKLRTYLSACNLTQHDFGVLVGVKQASISRLVSGDALPSLTLAAKIAQVTGEAVPMDAWVPVQEGKVA